MRFLVLTAALVFGVTSQPPTAAAEPIEEAYEVAVSDLALPTSEFGNVNLRPCDTCENVALRVDAQTRYVYEGQAMSLGEFRSAILTMKNRDKVAATVIYRLENGRVRQIGVLAPR